MHEPTPIIDGTVSNALQALIAAGPIPEQNLNVISLEVIQASMGDRWEAKREQVWNQVDKFLRHQFRPDDLIIRLDEVSVLIFQPGRAHMSAQTLCIRAASDLIRFFLGEAARTNVVVKTVVSIDGDEVVCVPIPKRERDAALLTHDNAAWAPLAAHKMPILTRQNRDLSMVLTLAPVLALQGDSGAPIGYAVQTVLTDAVSGHRLSREERHLLQSSDLADADLHVLTTAFDRRRELPNPSATLIVPVSFATLAHSSTRYAILNAVRRLSADDRRSLIWEIVDFEPGAPDGRVAELVSIARPQSRGVICQMDISISSAKKLKAAGATLSANPHLTDGAEQTLARLEPGVTAVLKVIPSVLFHDVPKDLVPVAASIGVTHCTVAANPSAG